MLEHIPDVQGVLDEVYRALQDGGVFYFAVPNHRWREKLWGGQAIFKCLGLKRLASAYERFFNKISTGRRSIWELRPGSLELNA